MWTPNQRQNAARLLLRRAVLLGLLFLVLLAASGVWSAYQKERESKKLRLQAEAERTDLLRRQSALEAEAEQLASDRGLEEALREQYALAEQGEQLIVIVDPPDAEPAEATSTARSWWRKVFWWW